MHRIIRALSWGSAMIGGALFALVVLITVINVGGFALNGPARLLGQTVPGLPGYEDAVSLFVGLGALLMLPWCQLQRGHVSVDLLASLLPAGAVRLITRLTDAVMGALAGFLAVMLAEGMLAYRADGVRTPVLEWLVWPFMAPGAAALALWAAAAFLLAAAPEAGERGTDAGTGDLGGAGG